jgi:hypothetical protein
MPVKNEPYWSSTLADPLIVWLRVKERIFVEPKDTLPDVSAGGPWVGGLVWKSSLTVWPELVRPVSEVEYGEVPLEKWFEAGVEDRWVIEGQAKLEHSKKKMEVTRRINNDIILGYKIRFLANNI